MPILAPPNKCYGCAACSNICAKKCIKMEVNEYGEWRPILNLDLCVECGQCTKVCAALKQPLLVEPMGVYAAAIQSAAHRKGCASGGIARALYEEALQREMVVFGCDLDENNHLRMRSADSANTIEGFRDSKYTFCRMQECYNEIKNLLRKNVEVLFIGTSCQVYALKSFLGSNQKGLITVDLICHGVPPENYFYEYLKYQTNRLKETIDSIKFRGDKRENDFRLRISTKRGCIYDVFAREERFFAGYVNCAIFEEKCYHCAFAKSQRIADISLGDWGGPTSLQPDKLSLILVNSPKGTEFINTILSQTDIVYEVHTVEEAEKYNEQLRGTAPIPRQYFEMREYYRHNGFLKMSKKYIQPYIRAYRRKKIVKKVQYFVYMPVRIARKIKRMVIKN